MVAFAIHGTELQPPLMYSLFPDQPLPLPCPGQLQLWLLEEPAPLSDATETLFASWLSAAEQARWQRFHFATDRRRFLLARALVRSVLARYCGVGPALLQFVQDAHGKPELQQSANSADTLRFNLSHTRGLLALAVTTRDDIGVDVESTDRPADCLALAARYFAAEEVALLESVEPARQREWFFRLWTLKEAYVKARGLGLKLGLDSFAFCFDQEGTAQLALPVDQVGRWTLLQYTHAGHFHIAVACNVAADSKPQADLHWLQL